MKFGLVLASSLAILSAITVVASAQECTNLARVIARESEKYGDSNQVKMFQKAQLCSSKYENSTSDQRAEIEAAYGFF